MPKKPLLLIDIDGVLNPFLSHEAMDAIAADDEENPQLPHKEVRISAWTICYVRHDLPEMIRRLLPHFELMWGTAWGAFEANRYMLRHLGLEVPLDGIDYHDSVEGKVEQKLSGPHWVGGQMPSFWKMPWIEKFAEESGRPFVFIDDEVSDEAEEWARERTENGIPTLMIKTDDTIGWTDDHTTQLIEWAEGIENGGAEGQDGKVDRTSSPDGAVG